MAGSKGDAEGKAKNGEGQARGPGLVGDTKRKKAAHRLTRSGQRGSGAAAGLSKRPQRAVMASGESVQGWRAVAGVSPWMLEGTAAAIAALDTAGDGRSAAL